MVLPRYNLWIHGSLVNLHNCHTFNLKVGGSRRAVLWGSYGPSEEIGMLYK